MSECERFEPTIEAYVAGELDDNALGPLLSHCRACADCRQLLELHRDLVALASQAPDLHDDDLDAVHARVLRTVDSHPNTSEARAEVPGRSAWSLLAGTPLRAVAALAAVLVFVAGLGAGRALSGRAGAGGNGGVTKRLVSAIGADASSNLKLADVEDSRFTYSNVRFRRLDDQRVTLDFDVTTHVQLVEPVQSEIVHEVLVHSLLNPSSTGTRLKAMAYAGGAREPKVREALIFAMQRDENLAVRLQALAILSDHLSEPEVESAVLTTLRSDESVQMRLMALDSLAARSVDHDRIRELIQETDRPGDEALMIRLAEYEKKQL